MTFFSVTKNSAESAPYTVRWSAVRTTETTRRVPIKPSSVAYTSDCVPPTPRMALVPVRVGGRVIDRRQLVEGGGC